MYIYQSLPPLLPHVKYENIKSSAKIQNII